MTKPDVAKFAREMMVAGLREYFAARQGGEGPTDEVRQAHHFTRTTRMILRAETYVFVELMKGAPFVIIDFKLVDLKPYCDDHGIDYDLNKWSSGHKALLALVLP
jgi:hypothetical protein